MRRIHLTVSSFCTFVICVLCLSPAHGWQARNAVNDYQISIKAYAGQPFGVGLVTLTPREPALPAARDPKPAALQMLGSDAFYPAVERSGGFSSTQAADELRVYFLFRAETAKQITVLGQTIKLEPISSEALHAESMKRWWQRYVGQARINERRTQYPAQIDQYLVQTLARRLKLPAPVTASNQYSSDGEAEIIGSMTGTKAVRLAMQKDALLGTSRNELATEDLPKAVSPPAIEIPEPDKDVEVESIAMAVPPELFYARFRKYENLAWFSERIDEWGLELSGIATQSGLQYDLGQCVQDQLNVYQSELAKHLSDAIIKDVAIIGSDTFIREGAGIGILFEAKSNELLKAFLEEQRTQRAAKGDGVTLSVVPLDQSQHTASLLASPDNRVGSFYVTSGDFHLITTSKTIARRFLETCGDATQSLGASKEFRYARTVTQVTRNDAAFIYLSDQFFRTFVDPAFRVEMTRRATSESEIELTQLAILSARAEGRSHSTFEELIDGGFLPADFLKRADGSQLVLKDGIITDSLRGARGSFLPLSDVQVEKVTKSEASGYERFSKMYARIWTWMDPATLAVQRHVLEKQERLVLDVHMYPYPRREMGFLDMLALKKSKQRLAPIPGVFFMAEANFFGMTPAFAGMADFNPPIVVKDGRLESLSNPEKVPWFIAGMPTKGLDAFLAPPKGREWKDGEITKLSDDPSRGFFETQFGYRNDRFSALSPSRFGLEPLVNNVKLIDADREAEMRIHIGDLANAKVRRTLDAGYWLAGKEVTEGHEELLNRMVTQFRVPAENAADTVESILQARPVSPLGGDYVRSADQSISCNSQTSLTTFEHPFIKRVRSADFELTTEVTTLTAHAEVLLDAP